MSSAYRGFAQRNNNVTQIVPELTSTLDTIVDISNCSIYTLNIPNVQYVGGIYYVDLSGVDLSGNLLNLDGEILGSTPINIVSFYLNIPVSASAYPGLEFTIFFKNIPFDRLTHEPLLTISIVSPFFPIPYIYSPPFPQLAGVSPSITVKSDGTEFNVASSGPAGWLGYAALRAIQGFYTD